MSTSTVTEAAVREAVRAQLATMPFDKIIGQPTNHTVNHLEKQIARMAAAVKSTKWGGRHGCIALVVDEASYRTITGTPTATVDRLQAPPLVPTALANNTTTVNRARIQANERVDKEEYWKQESLDSVIVDRIVNEAVDQIYVEELEDEYIGYANLTIKEVIKHLRDEWCVVTTMEKKEAADAFKVKWDPTTHITGLAKELDRKQRLCQNINVPATDEAKVQTYVENMYASERFDQKEMQAWEEKPSADKTWANVKAYFVPIYKSHERFNNERNARAGGYESANSVTGTKTQSTYHGNDNSVVSDTSRMPPTNITTGSMSPADQQTMIEYTNSLEGALNEAKEHTATMTTTQEKLMQQLQQQQTAMMEQQEKFMKMMMNLQVGSNNDGTRAKKNDSNNNTTGKKRRKCNNCGKMGFHEDDECWSLAKNKDKRPSYYRE